MQKTLTTMVNILINLTRFILLVFAKKSCSIDCRNDVRARVAPSWRSSGGGALNYATCRQVFARLGTSKYAVDPPFTTSLFSQSCGTPIDWLKPALTVNEDNYSGGTRRTPRHLVTALMYESEMYN